MYELDEQTRFGVATASLGMHPKHTIEVKFEALQKAGFKWVGLGVENFFDWVRQKHPDLPKSTCPPDWCEGGEPDPSDEDIWNAVYESCNEIKQLASSYGLALLVPQPMNQFDGWPAGHPRELFSRRKAERWLPMCARLGVEFLQVGSNNMPDALDTTHLEKYVEDMSWLASLGARQIPPVRIAYECWCFSVHVNTWELTWEIVKRANHPNLGLCLDVAHFPLAPSYGWSPTTGQGFDDAAYYEMVDRIRAVPCEKIFYVEISDMILPDPPLYKGSPFDRWAEQNEPVARGYRFIWTVCGRPLPLMGQNAGDKSLQGKTRNGGRVVDSLKAILSTGFCGPIVLEFFEAEYMSGDDETIPHRYAQGCVEARTRLIRSCENGQ